MKSWRWTEGGTEADQLLNDRWNCDVVGCEVVKAWLESVDYFLCCPSCEEDGRNCGRSVAGAEADEVDVLVVDEVVVVAA